MAGGKPSRAAPQPPDGLIAAVRRQCAMPPHPAVATAAAALRERFGDALIALLAYGSCLRDEDAASGLIDFYVVVECYSRAYPERRLRWLNWLLPPNVFYLRTRYAGGWIHAKYAVLSSSDLAAGISRWQQPLLWGRLAQPVRLVYARSTQAEQRIHRHLANAVCRFLQEAAPLLDQPVTAAALWRQGLAHSYATELRPERSARAAAIVAQNGAYYEEITRLAESYITALRPPSGGGEGYACALGDGARRRGRMAWRARRIAGAALSVLRLAKATFTFQGGVDYAAWKLHRHTGISIEVTPRLRRHPLVYGWPILWRLLRRGALR